ncbi:TPA: non-ribosomal peptide synthetase, partial [Streptococcus suis]|nr:non-ribosomal peptide synthetase [Streptococcus suis]
MELNNIKENAKALVIDWLKSIFADKSGVESENLIEKGLSSIQVMQLSGKLKKMGVKISFAKLMEEPVLSKWFELIDKSKVKTDKDIEASITHNYGSEFALTDVQYSYLIGREKEQILGGVGCHAYLEIDGENIEENILKDAWNKLQYRHPMLRTKFTKDGQQVILDKPYSEEIEVFDLSGLDEEMLHSKLLEIREQKSHRKLNVNEGQVAGIALAKFADKKSKIFFDVDLLVSDVMSMSIMIRELAELYSGVEFNKLDAYTFKDYIQNRISESTNKLDKEFWEQKINSFEIERPNLPLKKQPEQIKETKFIRRKKIIKKDEWEAIKNIAASYQSTPSMVLLTAYALVLERWCNQDKFFINIPLFNRDLENENLKEMVADFTNILLVEHETKDDVRFLDTLKRINKTFLENVSHSAYSGVQVQRDISKNQGTSVNIAPVVFACNIDYPLETEISRRNLGKVSYMISQTPGVWLDFQTYIIDSNLILCWDAVDELFPNNLLDDMMESLYELVVSLTQKTNWEKKVDALPNSQKSIRKQDIDEILPLKYPNETLYDGFLRNVKQNPDKVAIIDSETKEHITYHKLYENSLKIAEYLNKNG